MSAAQRLAIGRNQIVPFNVIYTLKCSISAVCTFLLGIWTLTALSDFRTMSMAFAAYFAFDVAVDLLLDATSWKICYPKRKLELTMIVHHIVGVTTMWFAPQLPVCIPV